MAKQEFVTNLIGSRITPKYLDHVGNPNGTWPVNNPNLSGEHLATIRGAWVEGPDIKLLVVTPDGMMFETYAVNVILKD